MRAASSIAFDGLAFAAMLAHLLIVGPLCLLALYMESFRGTELLTTAVKVLIVVGWCGVGLVGIKAWRERSLAVVAVPFLSLVLTLVLMQVGIADVHVRF